MATCTTPGCTEPRWTGPHGTNHKITKCEQHQRADWRAQKIRNAKPPTGGKRGRPVKTPPPTVKALVIDRSAGKVYRGEMEITCEKLLGDVRQLGSLIEFYRYTGHVIVERE